MKKFSSRIKKKNGSFNIITLREKESSATKVKMTMEYTWKTLWKGWKTTGEQGWMSLALSSFLLCENGGFLYTVVVFLLKEGPFLYLPSLQTFYHFLYCSILVLILIVQQHVPLTVRGMLLHTQDKCQNVIPPFEP